MSVPLINRNNINGRTAVYINPKCFINIAHTSIPLVKTNKIAEYFLGDILFWFVPIKPVGKTIK